MLPFGDAIMNAVYDNKEMEMYDAEIKIMTLLINKIQCELMAEASAGIVPLCIICMYDQTAIDFFS